MSEKLCACGLPLHYRTAQMEQAACAIVDKMGEFIPVTMGDRTWLVPRHYILLHGIKGSDLPRLGFKEVELPPTKEL